MHLRRAAQLLALATLSSLVGGTWVACTSVKGRKTCDPAATGANSECHEGYTCDSVSNICLVSCQAAADCLASEVCDIPDGLTAGVCRPGEADADGDGDAGGDA